MRRNLNPLNVHIGLAVAELARQNADSANAATDIAAMLQGVQRYQQSEDDIVRPAMRVVWQAGTVTLCCVQAADYAPHLRPVLIIPSMVNRSYIMNLTSDRSMVRVFADQGLAPYLLDWGESKDDAGQADFDAVFAQRLVPALSYVKGVHEQGVHVVGYCMGGLLAVALAQLAARDVASLTLLATPWDFHAGQSALRQRVEFWSPQAISMMQQKGFLDQDWLQMVFATLDPAATCQKFIAYAAMEEGSDAAQLFVAIEDWLNDGVNLPNGLARACIQDWFFDNNPARGQWQIAGQRVDPAQVACPALVVASQRDRLVDYDSACALYDQLPEGAQIVQPDCGHIGMIAGRNAVQDVWLPMAAFIASCNMG